MVLRIRRSTHSKRSTKHSTKRSTKRSTHRNKRHSSKKKTYGGQRKTMKNIASAREIGAAKANISSKKAEAARFSWMRRHGMA